MPRGPGITKARVAGTVSRLTSGDLPFDQQVEALDAVTRDPEILAEELGDRLAEEYPTRATAAAIELLRAAGADEAVAERRVEWHRARRRHHDEGDGLR
jgi:hypothetical protein